VADAFYKDHPVVGKQCGWIVEARRTAGIRLSTKKQTKVHQISYFPDLTK
jgi:hypothetical protein